MKIRWKSSRKPAPAEPQEPNVSSSEPQVPSLDRPEKLLLAAALCLSGLLVIFNLLIGAGFFMPGSTKTGGVPAISSVVSVTPDQALVDINEAGLELLATLPGVGTVKAQAIIDYRALNGPFRTVDELLEVPGIGETILAGLRELVTVEE